MSDRETRKAEAMMMVAATIAELSSCDRKKHGCVLTSLDFRVRSVGYNGAASGTPNHCIRPDDDQACGCVHAEVNAVANDDTPRGPRLAFVTGMPCEHCAAVLVNAGVTDVYWARKTTKGTRGAEVLQAAGVTARWMNYPGATLLRTAR